MAHSCGLGPGVDQIQGSSEVCDLGKTQILAKARFWHHMTLGGESLKQRRSWGEDSEQHNLSMQKVEWAETLGRKRHRGGAWAEKY